MPRCTRCVSAQKTRQVATHSQSSREEIRDRIADQLGERFSELAEPLLARGQLLGVLYLEGRWQRTRSRGHGALCRGLSRQIALLLLTARTSTLEQESEQARYAARTRGSSDPGGLSRPAISRHADQRAGGQSLTAVSTLLEKGCGRICVARSPRWKGDASPCSSSTTICASRLKSASNSSWSRRSARERSHRPRSVSKWLEPGEMLADSYRVIRILGRGASGCVYRVERTTDQRHLAAKVIRPRRKKRASTQFAREAQILARLTDPTSPARLSMSTSPSPARCSW